MSAFGDVSRDLSLDLVFQGLRVVCFKMGAFLEQSLIGLRISRMSKLVENPACLNGQLRELVRLLEVLELSEGGLNCHPVTVGLVRVMYRRVRTSR